MTAHKTQQDSWTAVIVVNYGTADLSIKAVQSVLDRDADGHVVRVYLVDNASPGGDAEVLKQAHALRDWGNRVQLLLEAENHGFGRGNNVALTLMRGLDTKPDKVFLLNPDAVLHNNAIQRLAKALDGTPAAVAAGAAVLREDLTPAVAAFRFPSWRSEIARIASFGPIDRLLAGRLVPLSPDQPTGPVDWVSGAAVMFRFDAVAAEGFFAPDFFLYYEEVDLMRRLRKAGGEILYVAEAQVLHAEGAATGQFASAAARQRDPWYLYQSWAHYFRRSYGRPMAILIALSLWPVAGFNILHRRLRGKTPTVPKQFFRDHWTHVVWPLLAGRQTPSMR